MVGGFLGDFVKGPLPTSLPQPLARGIRLHRAIDAFSDRHPVVAEWRHSLPPEWRRYAGVLLDMLVDHHLAANWKALHGYALEDFVDQCHHHLHCHRQRLPGEAALVLDRMLQHNWLARYADLDFTLQALARMSQRLRFANPLAQSRRLVEAHYSPLLESAAVLYADSQRYVAEWRSQNS